MKTRIQRRQLLQYTSLAGIAVWTSGRIGLGADKSPNEKLDIAVIGPGNRGAANLAGVSKENIVALCDVDQRQAGKAFQQFPKAKRYEDFRKLLSELDRQIDAVVVSTPDHTHAPAAMMAMRQGKHCYCEKPLAHNVWEVRQMSEIARKNKLATQLGTQIHAEKNYRRMVEIVQAGVIGPVKEVYCWMSRGGKPRPSADRPKEPQPVPEGLNWDLWLGPAPQRPYHRAYCPGSWRSWWDFGNGTLGDFGCHLMDLPFWALGLRAPLSVEAHGSPVHPETAPGSLMGRWEFPARGAAPPVSITWCHGIDLPPVFDHPELAKYNYGILFVGSQGMLAGHYGWRKLIPEAKFKDVQEPSPTIPDSIGHHAEWIRACKTGSPTTCNFDYSGALTEAVLLGTVAFRVGQKLQWDPVALRATNCPAADRFLRRTYRKGWEI